MKELMSRGLPFTVENARGEHPIHLASGARGRNKDDIEHVEVLLEAGVNIKKARTNDGCTAAHYAARSGSVETLRLLLDAECPVTKAKMNDDCRWFTVSVGDTLLQSAAKSCCPLKGSLVLDRIMAARFKERQNKHLTETVLGRREACCNYNYLELTTLELELSHMYSELERSLDNPFSALRIFLQNSPDNIIDLLDNCIIVNDDSSDNNLGKVIFDFFLFDSDEDNRDELDFIDLVISSGKKNLLEHPLFQTFIRLKWIKIWKVYLFSFIILCMFMISLYGDVLLQFSHLFDDVDSDVKKIFWILHLFTTLLLLMLQVIKLSGILFFNNCSSSLMSDKKESHLSDWRGRREKFYPILDTLSPVVSLVSLFLPTPCQTMSVFLILYSSWQFMRCRINIINNYYY